MESKPSYLRLFDRVILKRPVWVLLLVAIVCGFFAYKIKDFRLDASEDSLILEGDKDLKLYRQVIRRYGTSDYLLLTYAPVYDLLDKRTIRMLRALQTDLEKLPRVKSVNSILNIPLLRSPRVTLKELNGGQRTVETPGVDLKLAAKELKTSPIFREMLVSPDLKMTALQINLERDPEQLRLQEKRSRLLDKKQEGTLTVEDKAKLARIKEEYAKVSDRVNAERRETVAAVRALKVDYESSGKLFLGGVSMVTTDMIAFIRNDLKVFGCGMMLFIIVTLGVIFRKKRWIFLPVLCCILSAISMMGILGIFGWEVTVISSNFISLQLIVTMSLTIHLIVRYTELLREYPEKDNRELILETVRTIFKPCLYTSLTTIAGFSSLVACDILPVINFGWMMSLGLCVSLLLVFILFPAVLILMPKATITQDHSSGFTITGMFAAFTKRHAHVIFGGASVIAILIALGVPRLRVENSFIDYFRESTEIYQGMKVIDQQLGGTTPLDIVITLEDEPEPDVPKVKASEDDAFGEFSEFNEPEENGGKYWYTMKKMEQVARVHRYLESRPAIGKVLSLQTTLAVARDLLDEKELDNLTLALVFKELPKNFREAFVEPHVSVENNEVRFTMRIKDSMKGLQRDKLLKEIESDLIKELGLPPESIHLPLEEKRLRLTGIMKLYNNMLQSLFKSQIETIGFTVLALLIMFLILFRSVKLSVIAIIPNLLACLVVLGLMGWIDLPLDMMTITIVAISMGIAVDNTIHYIHRFRHEIQEDGDYMQTMFRCHGSIGNAMYYTSITIIVGFSILALSNFIPSVLFGVLTGVAMIMALLGALTLLPRLIILIKPFGPDRAKRG